MSIISKLHTQQSNEEEGMKLLEIINSGDYINPLSDPNTIIAQAKEVSYHGNGVIYLPSDAIGAG